MNEQLKTERKRMRKLRWVFAFVLLGLLLQVCFRFTTVHGISMQPFLDDGDCLMINRLSYLIAEPQRFDVIVFSYLYKPDTYYIKRIIGLPNETVRISEDGVIYVNGNVLMEHYGKEKIVDSGLAVNEITLGGDEYFVLGDNRNVSSDSRKPEVGNIKRSDIAGKGWLRILPFGKFGVL